MSDDISTEIIEPVLMERVRCDYDPAQRCVMELRNHIVLTELELLKVTGKSLIFENQERIACKVTTAFKLSLIHI